MLPVGCGSGVHVSILGTVNFGCDYDFFSGHLEILKNFTELLLGLSFGIGFSGIKKVDAIFEGKFDNLFVFFIVFRLVVDHVAE